MQRYVLYLFLALNYTENKTFLLKYANMIGIHFT